MRNLAILYPVFALAAWTLAVLLLVPFVRVRSVMRREIGPNDFKHGESPRVPGYVSIPNRNYMNLLELPILFYVVCLMFFVAGRLDQIALWVAWAYVAARAAHSVIHIAYNNVIHRLSAYALSNFILAALWILFFVNGSKPG